MKSMWSKLPLLFLFLFAGVLPLTAGENPAPGSLVLLRFAAGKTGLPAERFADVLLEMKTKIADWGGYAPTVSDAALEAGSVAVLFEKLKEARAGAPPDEAVVIGETTMSRADFISLARADAIVIPSIQEYSVEEEKRAAGPSRWKVRLKTSFDFILRDGEYTRFTRVVETMGYDPEAERALADAVKTVLPQFVYESEPLLSGQKRVTVLAVEGPEAFIGAGGKAGVMLGTEFAVRETVTGTDGIAVTREKGLLLVSEVTDDVSVGGVLYAEPAVAPGDTVEEVSRLGLEVTPYAMAFIPMNDPADFTMYAGVRLTLAKGVHTLRPLLAVESVVYPFTTYETWFPLRPFVGAEIRLHLGRLELAALPMIGLEEQFALAPAESSRFLGFGLRGLVQASILISRDLKLFLEGGYEYWFGTYNYWPGTREGFLAGGGISVKL